MKFCIIGLGRFGYQLAITLSELGMEVLGIDKDESIIASIRDKITQAVCMNITDEKSLHTLGIEDMDTVVISMGENFAQSILLTALLKKHLNIPKILARATNKIHEDVLKLVGADIVVLPERDMGIKVAHKLSQPFVDVVNITETFAITQVKAPKSFVGKTISELQLKKSRNVSCVGVKKEGEEKINLASPDYVITEDDHLYLAGETDDLTDLVKSAG
ncbi:MAG: TrkA family potassium uptake protein [bacterium]